jgi:MYXO-CTERM domain-containing protein
VPGCSPACGADQFCDLSQSPPTCVDDKCGGAACPGGGCCNPVTGACGNCPCEGVICPEGQACKDGQCDVPSMGSGGASSSTGVGGAGGAGGGGGSNTGGAGGTGNDDRGVFGLPTGGGGCSCEVAGDAKSSSGWLVLFGIPVVFLRRRVRAARIQKEVA